MTETPTRRRPSRAILGAPVPADASNVVALTRHPAFLRRRIARDAREVLEQVAEARESLARIHVALTHFRAQLVRARARLEPTRADSAATLAALDSGDVAEMERVRDAILARTGPGPTSATRSPHRSMKQ